MDSSEEPKKYRPSDYMRDKYPDLFSDSESVNTPVINKIQFEYHLDTLTNRSEEKLFEHFSRHLIEAEICPNLLPQTGPTGGGDSKTDSETYPVAEQIADRWYVGDPKRPSQERWAFAFSAKKEWKPKAQSDVKKIYETNRGYTVVYFVTNQFVSDKNRAEVETELKSLYHSDIRILDRNWITSKVFENERLEIALRTLHIDGALSETKKVGPEDYRKKQELEEIEKQIEDQNRYTGVEFQLLEDSLQAAILARGLELPRSDVDGRFGRAIRLAKKHGTKTQILRTMYTHAWTTFYWFNDAEELGILCKDIFELGDFVDGSDIERLSNLLMSLKASVINGLATAEELDLENRKQQFYDLARKVESNTARPSNALWATFLKISHRIQENYQDVVRLEELTRSLIQLLEDGEHYLEFPIMQAIKVIQEIGRITENCPSHELLFEKVVAITQERTGELAAGKLVLGEGARLFKREKTLEAIKMFGKAQGLLSKEESLHYLVKTLLMCGAAYFSEGLLWAARTNFLAATDRLISQFYKKNEIDSRVLLSLRQLIWIELSLGRIPSALAWVEILNLIEPQVSLKIDQRERFDEDRILYDAVFGIHILYTENEDLSEITFLPEVCERLLLAAGESAAWFALGDVDRLKAEKLIPGDKSDADIEVYFKRWVEQPAVEQIKCFADYNSKSKTKLSSTVIGCTLEVTAENNPTSIVLAESILSIIECLLATSLGSEIIPLKANFSIHIRKDSTKTPLPEFGLSSMDGEEIVEVLYQEGFYEACATIELRKNLRRQMLEIALTIITRIALVADMDKYFDRLVKDENAFDRAMLFSEIWILLTNLIGKDKKYSIKDWKPEHPKENKLKRIVSWISLNRPEVTYSAEPKVKPGEGEIPDSLLDPEKMRHDSISVTSLMDVRLWDKTVWRGVAYIFHPEFPPLMMIGFEDIKTGNEIFAGLRKKLGSADKEERLQVSIVRGLDQKNPHSYGVMLGQSLDSLSKEKGGSGGQHIFMISRINRMYPSTPQNLTRFLEAYEKFGHFCILPCDMKNMGDPVGAIKEFGIMKQKLILKEAWELGEHDEQISVLDEDAMPLIPSHIKDAPVLKALKFLKGRRKRT